MWQFKKLETMKIALITLAVMIICISNAFADIAPNPIKAKSIGTSENTKIKMVSERVVIDLYKDSSVVECYFYMKNEGRKQKINIGFPEMYFQYWGKTSATDSDRNFLVQENGKEVQKIDAYIPYLGSRKEQKTHAKKSNMKYEEQPWYLWDSKFKEGETKIIKVRYSLPNGQIYKGSRYFTYLLSTGSGWMGTIDTAEVIVNIKDFSTDLILKTIPDNYTIEENQICWKFYNLEPTTNNDIKIYYEPSKGYYEKKKAQKPEPTIVINDEILLHSGDSQRFLDSIIPNEILTIKILKDLKDTEKYTSDKEGVIIIYTKSYVIDKLKKLIESRSSNNHVLAYDTSSGFLEKYKLIINQTTYKDEELLLKILELKEDEIQNVIIKKNQIGKTCIIIKRKN